MRIPKDFIFLIFEYLIAWKFPKESEQINVRDESLIIISSVTENNPKQERDQKNMNGQKQKENFMIKNGMNG